MKGMKYFLITYSFVDGTEEEWHEEIARFIEALKNDSELGDKITYKALKSTKGPEYYHLATAVDGEAAEMLGKKEFFKKYTERCEVVSKGTVTVTPLELIAST